MPVRRSNAWLVVPMVAAVAALGWFLLGSSHGGPGGVGTDEPDATAGAAPDAIASEGGSTLAPSSAAGRRTTKADPAAEKPAAPSFTKAEGVFGRVIDPHEKPIAGAKVSLIPTDPTAMWGAPDPPAIAETVSAADGAYLVGPAPASRLKVRAEAAGYAATVAWVQNRGACVDLILDRGGAVKMHVKDPAGAAVKDAAIRYMPMSGWLVVQATTGEGGEATLEGLPTGQGTLRVTAKGRASVNVNDLVVESGKTVDRTCVLGGGIPVAGRVVDEGTGAALEGVEVSAKMQWDPSAPAGGKAKTDADGRFSIESAGTANDWVQVSATKDGYATAGTQIRLQAMGQGGGQEVTLKLARGGNASGIAGTVVDADARAVPGATVVYAGMTRAGDGSVSPTATTDASGAFTLPLFPGTGKEWQFFVGASAAGRGVGAAQASSAKPGPVMVRLGGSGIVTGKVTGVGDVALEGANVTLQYDWNGKQPPPPPGSDVQPWMYQQLFWDPRLSLLSTSTDASGTFRIEGVPTATFRVEATWGLDRGNASESVTVRAGGTESVVLTLGSGKTIEGRVLDSSGVGVAGAMVNGWDPTNRDPYGGGRNGNTRTDSEGAFKLRNVNGNAWQISVQAAGFAPQTVPSVAVGERALEVRLVTLGWIEGQVLADGAPFSGGFNVSAAFAGPNGGGGGDGRQSIRSVRMIGNGNVVYDGNNQREEAFSSSDGKFVLRGVTAGPWKLNVTTTEGWIPSSSVEVAVSDGRAAGPVEIRLVRGAQISGTVSEEGSADPVSGANVSLRVKGNAETGGQTNAWSMTDAKGRWFASGLAGGTYVLTASTPNGLSVEDEIALAPGQVVQRDLLALRFGSVTVHVLDSNGRAVENAQVTLITERGTYVQPNWDLLRKQNLVDTNKPNWWQKLQQTDAQGTIQRWHVPPGRIEVTVLIGALKGNAAVNVASDRNSEVTVTLPGSAEAGAPGGLPSK